MTAYGEAQYLLSCWENRCDKDEIIEKLNVSQKLTLQNLKRFTPKLIEVVKDDCTRFA